MKTIRIADSFGAFASNGDEANIFRFAEIEPLLAQRESVRLDFDGVTNLTSSFANALVATLVAHFPDTFPDLVRFENCCPVVKQMVVGAIQIGRRESKETA